MYTAVIAKAWKTTLPKGNPNKWGLVQQSIKTELQETLPQ